MIERKPLPLPSPLILTDAVNLASLFVSAVSEYGRIKLEEETERIHIQALKEIRLNEIREARKCFMDFMERHFNDRKRVFDDLFKRLDAAIWSGDSYCTEMVLKAIIDHAKTPSFRKFKEMLMDPEAEFVI